MCSYRSMVLSCYWVWIILYCEILIMSIFYTQEDIATSIYVDSVISNWAIVAHILTGAWTLGSYLIGLNAVRSLMKRDHTYIDCSIGGVKLQSHIFITDFYAWQLLGLHCTLLHNLRLVSAGPDRPAGILLRIRTIELGDEPLVVRSAYGPWTTHLSRIADLSINC